MTSIDYAALAARVLRHKPTLERISGLSRDRGIAIVAQAMRQSTRARLRQRLWLGGTLVSVAAAAALAIVTIQAHSSKKVAARVGGQCGASGAGCNEPTRSAPGGIDIGHSDGRDIMPGGVIQADVNGSTRVEFDSGTRMSLSGNTMLGYDEGSDLHRFSLTRGSVHLEVAKLKRGQRFLLNTIDAEVEVRGTVFDVSVLAAAGGCEQRTRVSVQEGVVEVRSAHELRTLRHGEAWQAECPKPSVSREIAISTTQKSLSRREPFEPQAKSETVAVTASGDGHALSRPGEENAIVQRPAETTRLSDLAKQNDIYARASTERNQGHMLEALNLYGQLIAKFPTSALVESSFVQRIRILRKSSHGDAMREGRQYLARFPRGFARDEVAALLDEP